MSEKFDYGDSGNSASEHVFFTLEGLPLVRDETLEGIRQNVMKGHVNGELDRFSDKDLRAERRRLTEDNPHYITALAAELEAQRKTIEHYEAFKAGAVYGARAGYHTLVKAMEDNTARVLHAVSDKGEPRSIEEVVDALEGLLPHCSESLVRTLRQFRDHYEVLARGHSPMRTSSSQQPHEVSRAVNPEDGA